MRRAVILIAVFLMALVAARGVLAGPQSKGSATLSGVVIGPDDKPVPHASVSYQSSGGVAPHAVYTDSRGRFTITKLKADKYDSRASSKCIFSGWEKSSTLRKGVTQDITLQLSYARAMRTSSKQTRAR